jgi:hypothetical protein
MQLEHAVKVNIKVEIEQFAEVEKVLAAVDKHRFAACFFLAVLVSSGVGYWFLK